MHNALCIYMCLSFACSIQFHLWYINALSLLNFKFLNFKFLNFFCLYTRVLSRLEVCLVLCSYIIWCKCSNAFGCQVVLQLASEMVSLSRVQDWLETASNWKCDRSTSTSYLLTQLVELAEYLENLNKELDASVSLDLT